MSLLEISPEVTENSVFNTCGRLYVVTVSEHFYRFLLIFCERLWHIDGNVDDFIAALIAITIDIWDALALQTQDSSRLSARWNRDFCLSIMGGYFERGAKHSLRNRKQEVIDEIHAVAQQFRMWLLMHENLQVSDDLLHLCLGNCRRNLPPSRQGVPPPLASHPSRCLLRCNVYICS